MPNKMMNKMLLPVDFVESACIILNMPFDSLNSQPTMPGGHPLATLPREDLDFIVELVLRSGSLKDLAAIYGVSYPTIRSRLDKLIDRVQAAVAGREPDAVSDLLATLVERGEVTGSAARSLRDAIRAQRNQPTKNGDMP